MINIAIVVSTVNYLYLLFGKNFKAYKQFIIDSDSCIKKEKADAPLQELLKNRPKPVTLFCLFIVVTELLTMALHMSFGASDYEFATLLGFIVSIVTLLLIFALSKGSYWAKILVYDVNRAFNMIYFSLYYSVFFSDMIFKSFDLYNLLSTLFLLAIPVIFNQILYPKYVFVKPRVCLWLKNCYLARVS